MVNQQLLDFINQSLHQGVSEEEIKNSLKANGWQENVIDQALGMLSARTVPIPHASMPASSLTVFQGPTTLLKQSWKIYKKRFKVFWGVMAIPTFVSLLLIVVPAFWLSEFARPEFFVLTNPWLLVSLGIFLALDVFIVTQWGYLALLFAIKDTQEGIGVIESYRRSSFKLPSFWLASILSGFILLAGFVLFVVPGIIFSVWLGMWMFVLISEDLKGMDVLLQSREYTRGRWGGFFLRYIFVAALLAIFLIISSLIFNFVKVPFAETIFTVIVQTFFLTPLTMIYYFLMYFNIKSIKSHASIMPTRSKKEKAIFTAFAIFGAIVTVNLVFLLIQFIVILLFGLG